MQPQPVSDVKPFGSMSWLRRRTPSVMRDVASGVSLRGIGTKFERYVIHILDSKSLRNASGQVLPVTSLGSAVWADVEASPCRSVGAVAPYPCQSLGGLTNHAIRNVPADELVSCGVWGVYSWPRHQIEASGAASFLGSGSQKYCTRRLHFSMSTPVIFAAPFLGFQVARVWEVGGEEGQFTR